MCLLREQVHLNKPHSMMKSDEPPGARRRACKGMCYILYRKKWPHCIEHFSSLFSITFDTIHRPTAVVSPGSLLKMWHLRPCSKFNHNLHLNKMDSHVIHMHIEFEKHRSLRLDSSLSWFN